MAVPTMVLPLPKARGLFQTAFAIIGRGPGALNSIVSSADTRTDSLVIGDIDTGLGTPFRGVAVPTMLAHRP